jgi:hypothetical protein
VSRDTDDAKRFDALKEAVGKFRQPSEVIRRGVDLPYAKFQMA